MKEMTSEEIIDLLRKQLVANERLIHAMNVRIGELYYEIQAMEATIDGFFDQITVNELYDFADEYMDNCAKSGAFVVVGSLALN